MTRKFVGFILLWAVTRVAVYAGTPQWVEVGSAHFTVVSDAGEKQARHILDHLERMRWVFQKLNPNANVDPTEPILVLAAKNTKTFQTLEPAAYLGNGKLELAGFFLRTQDRNFILLRLDVNEEQHPFAVVYHEYTHLQFRSAAAWMPLWLNEGFAEFFQNTQVREKDVLVGQPDFNEILFLQSHGRIPLPVLFKVDASSPYYHEEDKGSIFYAESWALTHYLEINDFDKHTHKVQDYLQLTSRHEDPVAAAEKAFGDLKKLQSDLDAYIRMGQYRQFVLNSAVAPIDGSSFVTRAITQADADADRAEILSNVQREKEARDLIAAILKADPNNAKARETMGEIEARGGNFEEARKWYGEAVKLDPKSCLANYYFAVTSMQSGHNDDSAIEPSLRAAIEINPDFAPAYERLAVYLSMQRKDTGAALQLIKTAIKLDPSNFAFRMNAANVLVTMGKYDDAIAVLGAAVKLARNQQQAAMAESQIENVRQFQQTQARIDQGQREPYVISPAPSGNSSGIVTMPIYNPKAAKLVSAGYQSIQHHEFETAQSQLDEAQSLNPEQEHLWANYGYLEYQRGNMSAAIPDYRKELALHPSSYGTYFSLASAQSILGQEKEAQKTLRDWADAQPDSPKPVTALVYLLLDEGHATDAAAVAEAFMARLPETSKSDQSFQLQAGQAQFAAGMKQKGEATLLALIHTTTSSNMLNDAAYELAKAGIDLDLAESTARGVLKRLTAESKTWTLQGNSQYAMAESRLIPATWDTLGWILYREGKMAEAETCIQPAWANGAHAEIGEHLAEIAEAKGNREEALRLYELALAAIPSYLRPAVRKTPGATQQELTEHIEALRKAGVKEPSINADDTLLQLRTISLGASGGFVGAAEYSLLLGNGEVLDAQKIGDKDVPTALERIKGVKIPDFWPKGSKAQLVRNAIVNCHVGVCELVFEP
jgi:tetratricopeptide (TPR) repeat protein